VDPSTLLLGANWSLFVGRCIRRARRTPLSKSLRRRANHRHIFTIARIGNSARAGTPVAGFLIGAAMTVSQRAPSRGTAGRSFVRYLELRRQRAIADSPQPGVDKVSCFVLVKEDPTLDRNEHHVAERLVAIGYLTWCGARCTSAGRAQRFHFMGCKVTSHVAELDVLLLEVSNRLAPYNELTSDTSPSRL
jgi:hypothetical protein